LHGRARLIGRPSPLHADWLAHRQAVRESWAADRPVLISGAGIAGPTLAFWLKSAGFEPTVIESAPALRAGGYVIDFWGLGCAIAERMGLATDINRVGYHMRELRIVDDQGARVRRPCRHSVLFKARSKPTLADWLQAVLKIRVCREFLQIHDVAVG
jgi:glycine/D-amino acid oxidase-like deaminating enzyme